MNNKRTGITALMAVFLFATIAWSVTDRVMEEWKKTLRFGISSQRSAVIKAIQDSKTVDAYPLIEQELTNDDSPDVRSLCAYALVDLKVSNESTWISSVTVESNSDVLQKSAFAIGELKVASAGPRLFDILTERITNAKDSMLCTVIIRTLGDLAYKPSASYLLDILTNIADSVDLRDSAAIALGGMADSSYIPVFESILQNTGEVKEVRMYSAYAMGRTGDPKVLATLGPIVDDEMEDLNVRIYAIAGLAFVKNESVFPRLLSFSRSDNLRVRQEAVKSLGNYSNAQSIEVLTFKALYDPETVVKTEAKKALQGLGVEIPELKVNAATNAWITHPASKTAASINTPTVATNAVKTVPVTNTAQKK